MTRSRFVHRSRPCDSSLQQYDPMGCHWLPIGAARAYHQAPRRAEKSGPDCVVWIREQHCREILGQLAKAASVERPIFNSEAFRLGAAKDAMCRSFMAVVSANLVDEARVTDTLGVWKVFQDRMGLVDCTYGLTEVWYDVQRGLRRRGVMGPPYFCDSARGQEEERRPWPEWMLPTPATAPPPDPSAPVLCQLWFGSVGKQVYAQANDAFEQVFMSTARVRQLLAESRLMSFYLWRLIVSTADMSAFYDRFVEALFAKEVTEAFLIARCHTSREEQVAFLISIAAHFAPGPDGVPVRGYCVRLWPTKPGSIDHYLTPAGEAGTMEGGGEQAAARTGKKVEGKLSQVQASLSRSEVGLPGEEGSK